MSFEKQVTAYHIVITKKLVTAEKCFILCLQMADAPAAHGGSLASTSKAKNTDDEIERQLAALKDL